MQIKLNLKPVDEITPAPIFVNEDFTIEWADYTDPEILTLLGFVKFYSTGQREIVDLDYQTFWEIPYLATDKYIILQNELEEWVSIRNIVELVEIIEDEPPEEP